MSTWIGYAVVHVVERLEWLSARVGTILSLLAVVTVGHTATKVGPPYAAHYRLHDRASAIVRAYNARATAPADTPELRRGLMEAVQAVGLDGSIDEGAFQIESTASRVRVSCRYDVPVEILPGRTHLLHFRLVVEEPVLPKPDPKFI